MANRIWNQEYGKHIETEQDTNTYNARGDIGDRANNLVKLIGADRVSRRDYRYEGTYYLTKNGEVYDNEYMNSHNPRRTGVSFYEVVDWKYNEGKGIYEPVVRRIVMIEMREYQLSLNL